MSVPVLLAIGVGGILLLLLLIVRFKVNAFLALLITSILVGLAAGVPLATIPATEDSPEKLGIIPAIIAGMGGHARLCRHPGGARVDARRIIELSGGASSLAGRFTKLLGPRRVSGALTERPWCWRSPSSSTSDSSSSCRSSTGSATPRG